MRQMIKQVLTVAALFLANTVGWAASTVNITKMINGDVIGDTNPGEVTSQIADGICTLTVTPAEDFYATVENITAIATVSGNVAQSILRAPLINEGEIEVTATESNADPSGTTTYSFTMPTDESLVEVTVDFQQRTSIADANITLAETSFTFTGKEVKPAIQSVIIGTELELSEDDYTVSYSDNINAGTATVTITGKKNYSGTATKNFEITKAASAVATAPTAASLTYTGAAQTLITAGTATGGTMQYSTDNKTFSEELPTATNAGEYAIYYKVIGDANHSDLVIETPVNVTIGSKALDKEMVSLEWTSVTYTGEAQTPGVTVVDDKMTLVENTDYTLSYQDNINIGTASVTVTGNGNYTGSVTLNFNIIQDIANEMKEVLGETQTFGTFLPKQALTVPTGVKAYVVTGINLTTRTVIVSEIGYLPAGVPVLLEKTGTEIGAASIYTGTTTDVNCILKSSGESGTTVAENSTSSYYVLYKDEYVRVTTGTTIAANKFYLQADNTQSESAPSRLMIIDNQDVSAIKVVKAKEADNIVYDLQGRRILHPVKGQLYIVNGNKVVIK